MKTSPIKAKTLTRPPAPCIDKTEGALRMIGIDNPKLEAMLRKAIEAFPKGSSIKEKQELVFTISRGVLGPEYNPYGSITIGDKEPPEDKCPYLTDKFLKTSN